jgi:hypothetical protein
MRKLITTITTIGVCVLTAACGGDKGADTVTPAPSTEISPVAEDALDGLLLSPAEIGATVGATRMIVISTSTSLAEDIKAPPDAPKEKVACIGIAGTAEAQAYEGSGSTAVRDQLLQTADGSGPKLTAGQSLVLFASAAQAADFLSASAERWSACREFTLGEQVSKVGPVSNNNGMLSTSFPSGDLVCQRALTATNNVAVEAASCGAGPESAVKIASQLVAKIAE